MYARGGSFAITINNFRCEQNTFYQSSGGTALVCPSSGYGFLTVRSNIVYGGSMGGTPGIPTNNLYSFTQSYRLGPGEKPAIPSSSASPGKISTCSPVALPSMRGQIWDTPKILIVTPCRPERPATDTKV